jgi:DNA-binding NarL/FixJ family response regulator
VLVADSKELFREGIGRLLDEQPAIDVVCRCGDAREAIQKAVDTQPDVVLIDADMSDKGTAEEIREAVPNAQVVVLTESAWEGELLGALRAGAKGYLQKDIGLDRLVKSIDLAVCGEVIVSSEVASRLSQKPEVVAEVAAFDGDELCSDLSDREKEIVGLIVEGATSREMAERLVISENTAKVHTKKILAKLQLRNKHQLAAYAVRKGLASGSGGRGGPG